MASAAVAGTVGGAVAPQRVPKTIVLLSDGTGNSAAKLSKTNVWRLYQALDLAEPEPAAAARGVARQVAYYDDGVGTSSFRPLAFLGGVFGWGLKRNVLDLYTFLCRNYVLGDRIYAFGFSRGAFTIRILVGLVAQQGVLRCATEQELSAYARDAYRAYRRCFDETGGLVGPLRRLRDAVIARWRRRQGLPPYGEDLTIDVPEIRFVGVWDTVGAYGMPVAEMTRGIDRWVWPLSMPNYVLSEKVRYARHALALDDERDTFHPLLWDEVAERRITDRPDRMRQVWFAGMHSDVGGGYPDDALAHVPLEWMMTEAEVAGLRFKEQEFDDVRRARNEHGPMHDSRRGVAGYYRYQPRRIGARTEFPDPDTLIMRDPDLRPAADLRRDPSLRGKGLLTAVRVHESVLNRIARGTDGYAPIVLPERFEVVRADRAIEPSPEPADGAAARAAGQRSVWNDVWRRRVSYFTTVGVSLVLVLLPLIHALRGPPSACVGPQCLLAPAILGLGNVLPGIARPWLEAFGRNPGLFLCAVLAIASLLLWSGGVQRRIQDRMRGFWRASLVPGAPAAPAPGRDWVSPVRTNGAYQWVLSTLKWRVFPDSFGPSVLAAGGVLLLAALFVLAARAEIAVKEWSGSFCGADADRMRAASSGSRGPSEFPTSSLCWPAGFEVKEGRRYRVTLDVTEPWFDDTIETSPAGTEPDRMGLAARFGGALLRRSPTARWFQPLAKIVSADGYHVHALEARPALGGGRVFAAEFQAERDGEVFLFVNDALLPSSAVSILGEEFQLYRNNRGKAVVAVDEVVRKASP